MTGPDLAASDSTHRCLTQGWRIAAHHAANATCTASLRPVPCLTLLRGRRLAITSKRGAAPGNYAREMALEDAWRRARIEARSSPVSFDPLSGRHRPSVLMRRRQSSLLVLARASDKGGIDAPQPA